MALRRAQFKALVAKKVINTRRNVVVTVVQLLLPVLFTIGALAIAKTGKAVDDSPSRLLSLRAYKTSEVLSSGRDLGFDT